jgi:hypothetical protein
MQQCTGVCLLLQVLTAMPQISPLLCTVTSLSLQLAWQVTSHTSSGWDQEQMLMMLSWSGLYSTSRSCTRVISCEHTYEACKLYG